MSYLLDTNVVSEVRKGPRANAGVREWFASVRAAELYLSVLVVGEVRQGIEKLRPRDPQQAKALDAWLTVLNQDFADRIVPITHEIAEQWGRLNAPVPLPTVDGLLAATAMVRGMTLVTRNTEDVSSAGVRLLDPFTIGA